MASIRKHRNRWQVQVRRQGIKGLSRSFLNKADALAWARQTEAELDRTGFIPTTGGALNASLGSLLERYAREISPSKKGGDIETIRLKQICATRLGSIPMAKLGPNHVREYMTKRLEQVSGDTVRRELVIVQHAIETARKCWGLPIYSNPVRQVHKPSASEPRKRRLFAPSAIRQKPFFLTLRPCKASLRVL
jgi:hypothetical protein